MDWFIDVSENVASPRHDQTATWLVIRTSSQIRMALVSMPYG